MNRPPARPLNGTGRPVVHLTPPAGWMNDPHGFLFQDGAVHVFYQAEPDSLRWGTMRWGHASSRDLLTWQHLPIALEPDADGPDAAGCWSGSVVRDDAGTPTIFYTGVVRRRGVRRAAICAAVGEPDLITWAKPSWSPVIAGAPPGIRPDMFRDPFVWRDDDGWSMLVGAGTETGRGTVLRYRSNDLRQWHLEGPFLTIEDLVAGCPDFDIAEVDGPCWECPQLLAVGDKALLVLSIVDRSPVVRPAHVVAVTGRIVDGRLVPEHAERLGLGPDFYAPSTATLADGRAMLFGWIPEDPPVRGEGRTWTGALTLPRVVSVDAAGRPVITLAAEAEELGRRVEGWTGVVVDDTTPWTTTTDDEHVELRLSLRSDGQAPIRLDLEAAGVLVAEIRFEPRSRRLTAARIGRILVAGRDPHGATTLPPETADRLDLRIILDGSILEVAAADRVTATIRLPSVGRGHRTFTCSTFGGSFRLDAELWTLRRAGG